MSLEKYYIRRNSELQKIRTDENTVRQKTISTIQSDAKENIKDSILKLTNKADPKETKLVSASQFFREKGY